MNVLYIAKRGPHNIAAKTHLKVIQELYGEKNVFVIDLLSAEEVHRERFNSYGYNSKKLVERTVRFLEGNSTFISNKIIAELCDLIRENGIQKVFSEESDLGNLYLKIKKQFPQVKVICFFHDISADLFKKRIEDSPKWKLHYILECKQIIKQEAITQKVVDARWVFNQADADRFYSHYGKQPDCIIPMGAPAPECNNEYKTVITSSDAAKIMLFVCSSYYVNIEGFKWFYSNVLPKLDNNYHIVVVGSGAQQLKGICLNSNVEILGRVESMTEYYEKADVVIEPVFDGGGMKVKTIEALSFGKMLISTSESLNGYWERTPESICNKLIYRCNTAEEWIAACNTVISNPVKRFNEEIYQLFMDEFSDSVLKDRFYQHI